MICTLLQLRYVQNKWYSRTHAINLKKKALQMKSLLKLWSNILLSETVLPSIVTTLTLFRSNYMRVLWIILFLQFLQINYFFLFLYLESPLETQIHHCSHDQLQASVEQVHSNLEIHADNSSSPSSDLAIHLCFVCII